MQLLSADSTILLKRFKKKIHKNMKKKPSKVGHIWPNFFFSTTNRPKKQPKYQFLFHKICSLLDLCITTLNMRMYLDKKGKVVS